MLNIFIIGIIIICLYSFIYYLMWEGTGTETDLTGALEMSGDLDLRCWTPLESCPFWWRTIFLAGPVSQQVGSVVSVVLSLWYHYNNRFVTGSWAPVGNPSLTITIDNNNRIFGVDYIIVIKSLNVFVWLASSSGLPGLAAAATQAG